MPTLTIERTLHIPMLGTWKWQAADYTNRPLTFRLKGPTAYLYLDPNTILGSSLRDREAIWTARVQLRYTPPPRTLVSALKTKTGVKAREAAQDI